MSAEELRMLRPTAPSMGMMLETTSRRAVRASPGRCTTARPTRIPRCGSRVIEDAGRERIPFTTGILVGIGETLRDRAESLVAIRARTSAR